MLPIQILVSGLETLMSRGPGHIEQTIEALFTSAPSQTFSTEELAAAVYRGVNRIEKKHRVAVLRAADKVAKRLHWQKRQCERWGIKGSIAGRGSIYFNKLDLHSYAIGWLRQDNFHAHMSIAELEEELHNELYAKHIQTAGAWWLHVENNKAKAGLIKLDRNTKRMIREHKKQFEVETETLKGMFPKVPDKERERRMYRKEANEHASLCGRCGQAIAASQPIARIPVATHGGMLGGHGATLEVQCLGCANTNFNFSFGGFGEASPCAFCGREVYNRWRSHRRRNFCCETCRRKWKARINQKSNHGRQPDDER